MKHTLKAKLNKPLDALAIGSEWIIVSVWWSIDEAIKLLEAYA